MDYIMVLYILRYESPEKYYGVLNDCELFDTTIDGWRLYERCRPGQPEMLLGLPAGVCYYAVVLETEVSTQEQLQARQRDALKLTDKLDRVWTYTAGYPFNTTTHPTLLLNEGPERWHTNYQDVDRAIEHAHSHSRFVIEGGWSIEPRQSIWLPMWPLKPALKILELYRSPTTTVETHDLIELHYQSLISRDTDSQLLFLAKALELGQALFPGDDRPSKQQQLAEPAKFEAD